MFRLSKKVILTTDSTGGFSPASSNKIFQSVISLKRAATVAPDAPPPAIMKSYVGKSIGKK